MPRLYSGSHKDFYRVWERPNGRLLIEVLHENSQWRNRLLGNNPRIEQLADDVLNPASNNIRAAMFLQEVIEDYPAEFAEGQVDFVARATPSMLEEQTTPCNRSSSRRNPEAVPAVQPRSGIQATALLAAVGREFFYKQLLRLPLSSSESLTDKPGLYAMFETGELLGRAIAGIPSNTLRCVKVGKSEKSVLGRIEKQYFGKNHRAAVPRKHIGDALIGRAICKQHEFAGFSVTDLPGVQTLWNAGTSAGAAIRKEGAVARAFGLAGTMAVTQFEAPIEREVTLFMQRCQFIGIPAPPEDTSLIEDPANSLLRDVAELDSPSSDWLGKYSSNATIRDYGLWAVVGVTRNYQPYGSHSAGLCAHDDQDRPIADWLHRFRELVDDTE